MGALDSATANLPDLLTKYINDPSITYTVSDFTTSQLKKGWVSGTNFGLLMLKLETKNAA